MTDEARFRYAIDMLRRCVGKHGFHAAPTRYPYQCWTRDFALAIRPVSSYVDGGAACATAHIDALVARQRADGKIPILYLDGLRGHARFLAEKIGRSLKTRQMSFMLGRYLKGQLGDLTPGTRDSEIMFARAVLDHARETTGLAFFKTRQASVTKALDYVQANLLDSDGMILGCDWRDTMHLELRDKPLLSNNSILYSVYQDMAYYTQNNTYETLAKKLRAKLSARWENDVLVDYPGAERFDPFGGALAVLHGVVGSGVECEALIENFRSVDTPCGVSVKCKHNPQNRVEATVIKQTDGVVVWPFIVGYTVLALKQMCTGQGNKLAAEQWAKMKDHTDFCEWIDPRTTIGFGASEQLWSAALYLRAEREMTS